MIRGIVNDEPALSAGDDDSITLAIEQALAVMPPKQREVTALRLRYQMPTAQIATRCGISPAAVERHLSNAAKDLRSHL